MPDEEIDKLVRDAASQHHPPYDDTAWGKMEVLLDKHLPQKKDRRRPVIFLLSFLVLGGAAYWGIQQAKHNSDRSNTITNTAPVAANTSTNNTSSLPGAPADNAANGNSTATTSGNTSIVSQQPANTSQVDQSATGTNPKTGGAQSNRLNKEPQTVNAGGDANAFTYPGSKKYRNQKGRTAIKVKQPGAANDDDNTTALKTVREKNDVAVSNTDIAADAPATKTNGDETVVAKTDVPVSKTAVADNKTEVKPAAEKTPAAKPSAAKQKTSSSFADKFAITVSAGADLSYIELNQPGKIKPVVGAGVAYAVGKHIRIGTGLYVAKKVYTASPYQYKFSGYVNPSLKQIGADCKVFEIPLSVYYSFKQSKNHSWLAGVSLSSLLMKRETYDYQYETPSGQTYSYDKTVTNENKHYFSVLTLSGGYQYKLSNRIAFIAEPYLKVPLSGIGLGKIKLNSTGMILTAAIRPFSKKKK